MCSPDGSMRFSGSTVNCLDNAAMESFFGTLKCELFYVNEFENVETLKGAIHEYIHYYNVDRIKLGLGALSPVEYGMKGATAITCP